MTVKDTELTYLRRCVELAGEALEAGDEPFGSVLVGGDGAVLAEDHNRVASGDRTRHPEFELARWSAARMTAEERAAATVYTSGEHCPMCAAAHAWVGLGRIVYVASSYQLASWLAELGVPAPPCGHCRCTRWHRAWWWRARCRSSWRTCVRCTGDSTGGGPDGGARPRCRRPVGVPTI